MLHTHTSSKSQQLDKAIIAKKRDSWLEKTNQIISESGLYTEGYKSSYDWYASFTHATTLLKQAQQVIHDANQRIKELERISSTDELTGIANRRGFMRQFDRELDRVQRDHSQGGVLVMIDVDNFKLINDKYGHQAGDLALKIIASTLANDIRQMDVTARMGGDEFVILFANTSREAALERVQFFIKKLNSLSFIWDGQEIEVRASLGVKGYKKGSKAEHIFHAADADMYDNKKKTNLFDQSMRSDTTHKNNKNETDKIRMI